MKHKNKFIHVHALVLLHLYVFCFYSKSSVCSVNLILNSRDLLQRKKRGGGGVVLISQNSCWTLSEFYWKKTCRDKALWREGTISHSTLGLKFIWYASVSIEWFLWKKKKPRRATAWSDQDLELNAREFFIQIGLIEHGLRKMKHIFYNKPSTIKCWIAGKLAQFYFYHV